MHSNRKERISKMQIQELEDLYPRIYQYIKTCIKQPNIIADYISEAREKTAYYKYGIGGQCIHRGAMCADPFYEIDCNISRGKLTNKEPKRKEYYRYSFDFYGRLLLVEKYCDVNSIEVLRREGEIIYGFMVPVEALTDLHSSYITVYGNILVENRIEAEFYTYEVMLDADLKTDTKVISEKEVIMPHFEGNVICYQDNLPFRYFKQIRTKLSFNNGSIINQKSMVSFGYELFLNDIGDVVECRSIRNEHNDGKKEPIRKLERAIPRKQWDNCFGLL